MKTKHEITKSLSPAETVRFHSFRLYGVKGKHANEIVDLNRDVIRLGSQSPSDLVIKDASVSRIHCELRREADGHYIVDQESKNGTFVNGVQVTRARLESGHVIRLGETEFRFEPKVEEVSLIPSSADHFGDILGKSFAMRKLYTLLERAAPSDLTLLITGETGTGKKTLAKMIHQASPRAAHPYVTVGVSALSPIQLEARLFATHGRVPNAFFQAQDGTLFIEGIDEMPLELQSKFLKIIETREIWNAKTDQMDPINVRVICSTVQDLKALTKAKKFREDLFFRLSVLTIKMPTLRERTEDIAFLTEHFLGLANPKRTLSPEAMDILQSCEWSGNVQELRNVLERAVAMSPSSRLEAKDLLLERPKTSARKTSEGHGAADPGLSGKTMEEIEKLAIEQALNEMRWNRTAVAKRLGIAYSTLYEKMRKYGLMDDKK